ncbi:MAG: RloB domain-containing protein [Actinobacteria bacterium]|nr:RloB domain-containing protein [Actinomycetota bacterium]
MAMYRGKKQYRKVHPKIFVWSHTQKAEIEYFQDFKNHLRSTLLMPKKDICWTPQELLEKITQWKNKNICEEDNDQVWCIFDVDDFYRNGRNELIKAVENASRNNIKIAYTNECFELWILLHFMKPTSAISRGKNIEKKIQNEFKKHKLGEFKKNQKVFDILLQFQSIAVKNAIDILPKYNDNNWEDKLSERGNPSTSLHFLVDEINRHIGNDKIK